MSDRHCYPLTWNGVLIGYLETPITDQYYVSGTWIPLETDATRAFLKRAHGKDFLGAATLDDLIWVHLGDAELDYQVILFANDELTLRLNVDPEDDE